MPKFMRVGNVPQKSASSIEINSFRGVDLTSSVTGVHISRSPDCVNMMSDLEGFPVKRYGYRTEKKYSAKINGGYSLNVNGEVKTVIHSGKSLYLDDVQIYSAMQNEKSRAMEFEQRLYIIDGSSFLVFGLFDGEYKVKKAEDIATVPVITIGRRPNGGGESYNPQNLLTGFVEEHFLGDATSKSYQLSYTNLCQDEVTVKKLDTASNWQAVTGFTVDRVNGIIAFSQPIGTSPITGQDNVKIVYKKPNDASRINTARVLTLYGVNGQPDRLWLASGTNGLNRAYYSQFRDPLYFGDVWYTLTGGSANAIMGFSVVDDRLVLHKQGEQGGQNAFVLEGKMDADSNATFPITNVLQGEGAIAHDSFKSFGSEPLFLTKRGIYALAQQDTLAQRYSQNRSYFINGKLQAEQNLQNAISCVWGRFYLLFVNGRVYLLDSEKKSYEKNSPYSTYQYECFVWDNINATAVWIKNSSLYFGDENGNVMVFNSDKNENKYFDISTPVNAYWTTPLLNLGSFSRYKTVSGVWVICQPYTRSGAEVYFASDKEYERLAAKFNIDIFNFDDIDFNRFTFNTLDRPSIEYVKRKAKKVKLFQVKIQNNQSEPFGISALQMEYRLGGKIK